MSKTIEELLHAPYWIIDILPERVPENNPGRYFTIEEYWRRNHLPEIRQKHLSLILKLNCYRDISLDEDKEINISPEKIADAIYKRYVNIMVDDAMIVSEPEDTYLTIYNPDEDLLTLVRELASREGMFVWKNENS